MLTACRHALRDSISPRSIRAVRKQSPSMHIAIGRGSAQQLSGRGLNDVRKLTRLLLATAPPI